MKCKICGAELAEDAKFCSQCGAKIMKCSSCGTVLEENAKFCSQCGAKVGEEPQQEKPNREEEIEKLRSQILLTVNERTAIKYHIEEPSFDNDKQEEPILDSDVINSSELDDNNLSDQEVQQGLIDLLGDDAPIIIDNEDKPSQSVISDNNGIKIVSKWEMLGRLHDYLTEMVQTECTRRGIDITSANGKKIQCQVANEIREDNSILAVFVKIYKENFPNTEVDLND